MFIELYNQQGERYLVNPTTVRILRESNTPDHTDIMFGDGWYVAINEPLFAVEKKFNEWWLDNANRAK